MSDKPKYNLKEFSKIDPYDRSKVISPKIDGGHSILKLREGKLPRIFSHRVSSRTGSLIEYTPKLRHITEPAHVDAVVRAETFAVNKAGEAVHPNTVAALLNRTVENSLSLQDSLGLRTRTALIDIDSYKNKSTRSLSFEKKREILEEIAKTHKNFMLPPLAKTPEQKIKLLKEIKSGTHKLTQEGVIEHDLKDIKSPFTKAPLVDTHDIYVRKIFKEESKSGRAPMAGGFWYSWDAGGPIVGKVGTGFSHDLKYKMLKTPERYIGRVAKIRAHDISKNKVLVKPSFIDWHVEKNLGDDGWAKQSIIVPKSLAQTRKDAERLARPHADRIYTSRETGSSFRFRQRPPERFEPGSFRHWNHPSGVGILFGKLREGGMIKKAYADGFSLALENLHD